MVEPLNHCSSMKHAFLPLVLLSIILTGCANDTPEAPIPDTTDIEEHQVEGRIVRILENARLIQVAHGDVEGFMSAMTMPFEFRSADIREAVEVGDSIHFTVATDGVSNWITEVTVIE